MNIDKKNIIKNIFDQILIIKNSTYQKFEEIIKLKPDFIKKLEKEHKKLPFQINLLDEIHANENSHSRILSKIFQFKKDNQYLFLKQFFKSLKKPFEDLVIDKPEITAEKDRIDILKWYPKLDHS